MMLIKRIDFDLGKAGMTKFLHPNWLLPISTFISVTNG